MSTSTKTFKAIFAVHYTPQLAFFDRFLRVASSIDGFPHWETDHFTVSMWNTVNWSSLKIANRSITFEVDRGTDEFEEKQVSRFGEILSQLEITSLTRLGYRRRVLQTSDYKFHELVRVLESKLHNQDCRLSNIVPGGVDDLFYRVDTSEAQLKHHITVGPLAQDEANQHVNFNPRHVDTTRPRSEQLEAIHSSYPEVSILTDIDTYRIDESIPVGEIAAFYKLAKARQDSFILGLEKYLGSASIDIED